MTSDEKSAQWQRLKDRVEAGVGRVGLPHAFLRYDRAGARNGIGSDWDIAVRETESWRDRLALDSAPLLDVQQPYVRQLFYKWGQVDLLETFEWQGAEYLSQERFWARVEVGDDGIARPCLAHDGYIAWMTSLLWGGKHPAKYEELIVAAQASDADEFRDCCEWAFGREVADQLIDRVEKNDYSRMDDDVADLRRALRWQAICRDAGGFFAGFIRHWVVQVKHHVRPPFPWVALLGPDGSGKSTLIAGLRERLAVTRIKVREVHWCPTWNQRADSGDAPAVKDPHGQRRKGLAGSVGQLGWIAARWWRARLGAIWHGRAKETLLISDRYYADMLVDPQRFRNSAPRWLMKWVFAFLPKPDVVVILTGEPREIQQRKEEVSLAETTRQCVAYAQLAKDLGRRAVCIDALNPPDEIADEVFAKIFEGRAES